MDTGSMASLVSCLRREYETLSDQLPTISSAAWKAPTICNGWTVTELVAHIAKGAARLAVIDVESVVVNADSLTRTKNLYYTAAQRADPSRDRKRARGIADFVDQFPTPDTMVGALQTATERAITRSIELRSTDNVRAHWGIVVPAAEYVRTRLVEVAVHGIDIADAIGRVPWISERAINHLNQLFTELAGSPWPPHGFDGADGVRLATGRLSSVPADATAARLPLLS